MAAACDPDGPPHAAGVSGVHADAVRHVLQHLDLPRGRGGLRPRVFPLLPSRGSQMMIWTHFRHRVDCICILSLS